MIRKLVALACCAVLIGGVVAPFSGCSKTPETNQNTPGADAPPPRSERPPAEAAGDVGLVE